MRKLRRCRVPGNDRKFIWEMRLRTESRVEMHADLPALPGLCRLRLS